MRQDELRKMVFHSVASWQCKPGFSTDKVVGGQQGRDGSLQMERNILFPAVCHNSDDCVGESLRIAWRVSGQFRTNGLSFR